jgi:hypothetical protein
MAASTLANLETSLKRIYSDEFFEVALNTAAPFWQMLQEEKNLEPEGEGYYWPFYLATSQNIGTPGENANLPATKQRTEVQGRIRPGQFIATFEISFILEAVGSARGAWNKGEVKRHMFEAVTDLTKHCNRLYAGTHGTGRLAVVEGNASGETFVAELGAAGFAEPHGAHLLRPKMPIEFYSDDTGTGTLRYTGVVIDKITQGTRTVDTDTTLTNVVDGDMVYVSGSYGQTTVPNGIMGIVDDGTLLTTIHNQSRSTYEELKSTVISGSSLSQLSEADLLNGCFQVLHKTGQSVTDLLMNVGQIDAYLAFVRPDRRYTVGAGESVPGYKTGYDESKLAFHWGGKVAKIHPITDLPPRTTVGITRSQLRRFTLKKMNWVPGTDGGIFSQGVNSSGYKTTKQATLAHLENIGTFMPAAHFRISDKLDRVLAGSTFGGTDTF